MEDLISSDQKPIAVIGSPSKTSELTIDILQESQDEKLVGEMAIFPLTQSGKQLYVVGQIVEVELKNRWHEDQIMRNLIKRSGSLAPISGKQDTRTANMRVGAVFALERNKYLPDILGSVPPTGTFVYSVTDRVIDNLLKDYKDELFYLGTAYGTNVKLPMWFKHFGSGPTGAGEAYHIGIFGKTGSGKTVLAANMLVGYAKHKEMGVLVIDPQRQFTKAVKEGKGALGAYDLDLGGALKSAGRVVETYSVAKDISLDRWNIFITLLKKKGFFKQLLIKHPDNQETAGDILEDVLRAKKVTLSSLNHKESLHAALDGLHTERSLAKIYSLKDRRAEVEEALADFLNNEQALQRLYDAYWRPLAQLFEEGSGGKKRAKIEHLVYKLAGKENCPVVILDVSTPPSSEIEESEWDDEIQLLVIKRIVDAIVNVAEQESPKEGLNMLVVFDEAHRFVQRSSEGSIREGLRSSLIDAVRTTRKFGAGWLFITQTLSSLDKEILNQLRIMFFGFGLNMGTELRALEELAGGDKAGMSLYRSFRDPTAVLGGERSASFMVVGPVSPLSFGGSALFLTAFRNADTFLRINNL